MSKIVDIINIILEHYNDKGFQTFRTENYLIKSDGISFDVSPYSETYWNLYFLSIYPELRNKTDGCSIIHSYNDGTYLEYYNMTLKCGDNKHFDNPLSTDDMFHLSMLYDTSVILDLIDNFKYNTYEIYIYDTDMINEPNIEIDLLHKELTKYANISGYSEVL